MKNKQIAIDEESYKEYLEEIERIQLELAVKQQRFEEADKRILDGMFLTGEVRILKNDIARLTSELKKLQEKNYVIAEKTNGKEIVTLGNIYLVKFDNMEDAEPIKMVEAIANDDPFYVDAMGRRICKATASQPVGRAILGKPVGGTYQFVAPTGVRSITVIEECGVSSKEVEECER